MILSDKVINSINKYLKVSNHCVISVGIYIKGRTEYITFDNNGINNNVYKYDIGSISKTFTAHLVLKLHEEKKINIYDSIDKYLDLKKGKYPRIIELLSHTAGYHKLTPIEITIPNLMFKEYSRRNVYEKIKNDDIIKCLNRRRKHKVGTYGYSDFAYAVLGLIVSKVFNTSFGDVLKRFIKEDLNLLKTELAYEAIRDIKPYIKNKEVEFWKWNKDNPYLSGGGIVSTIEDMLKYITNQLESEENFIIMAHNPQKVSSHIVPCLGWHTYQNSNQYWHVGGVSTFRSSLIFNKKRRIGLIVMGNAKGLKRENVHYIAKQIYSEINRNKIKLVK